MKTCTIETTNFTGLSGLGSEDLLFYIKSNIDTISYAALFKGLEQSTTVINEIIYRTAILSKEGQKIFDLTKEVAERKAQNIVNNRRKRFVRRIWRKYPLFALQLIKERYIDYSEDLLVKDITIVSKAKKKKKFIKNVASFGLRISQINKLTTLLKFSDVPEKERNTVCNKIAGYLNGLKLKTPILLSVNYSGVIKEYSFRWNETENKIKTFVQLTKMYYSFSDLDNAWCNRFSYGD